MVFEAAEPPENIENTAKANGIRVLRPSTSLTFASTIVKLVYVNKYAVTIQAAWLKCIKSLVIRHQRRAHNGNFEVDEEHPNVEPGNKLMNAGAISVAVMSKPTRG